MNQLPERDLPPGRHRLLKEHLMAEIRHSDEPARARRPWLRPVLVAGAAAAIVAVTLTFTPPSGGDSTAGPPASPPAAQAPDSAPQVLEQVALAAAGQDAPEARDDEFTYVRSRKSFSGFDAVCEPWQDGSLVTRELWKSVDGSRPGLVRDPSLAGDVDGGPIAPDADTGQTYRDLEALPTDPEEMLAWLYGNKGGKGERPHYYAFKNAFIVADVLPPEVSAALYRAVADIPGVELVKDAEDAVGRHGTAVGFVDERGASRVEMVFDPETWLLLGTREVMIKDSADAQGRDCTGTIKAGSVLWADAVMERGVVDAAGKRPR
ncbi:CU044_5270 family protein [Streptomyces sp. MAR4 CNX-425]|uniref:CU044_5270 family protein n=1 Tax=Streptomyces sp. MAR4 CNX-425 TaxID=3406343 RepID=UPI003B50FA2D